MIESNRIESNRSSGSLVPSFFRVLRSIGSLSGATSSAPPNGSARSLAHPPDPTLAVRFATAAAAADGAVRVAPKDRNASS